MTNIRTMKASGMNHVYQRMKFDRNPINTECNVTHLIIFMSENI